MKHESPTCILCGGSEGALLRRRGMPVKRLCEECSYSATITMVETGAVDPDQIILTLAQTPGTVISLTMLFGNDYLWEEKDED